MTGLFAAVDTSAPGVLAPAWFVVPLACITLGLVYAHLRAQAKAEMPESRRRIRSACGLLLLLLPALLTYALSMVSPQRPAEFVLAWCAVAGLLFLIVLTAVADVLNTLRIHRRESAALRAEMLGLRRRVRVLAGGSPLRAPTGDAEPGEVRAGTLSVDERRRPEL